MGQKPGKYHVTDDGKVFIINEDGTFSVYGCIQPNTSGKFKSGSFGSFNKKIWRCAVLLLIVLTISIIGIWYKIEDGIFFYDIYDGMNNLLLNSVRYLLGICIVFVFMFAYVLYALRRYNGSDKS